MLKNVIARGHGASLLSPGAAALAGALAAAVGAAVGEAECNPIGDSTKLEISQRYNRQLVQDRAQIYEAIKGMPRIPELDYQPTARYRESTKEEVLHPLVEKAQCILVPGAYFGDEGKGKTVDAIARHPEVTVVARVNSGENAGHTVIGPTGHKYDFHLCPSGLLTPGKVPPPPPLPCGSCLSKTFPHDAWCAASVHPFCNSPPPSPPCGAHRAP